MNRRIIAAIAVIIGVAAIGAWVYAGMDKEENKQKVAITELPVAVQKTIQDNPRQSWGRNGHRNRERNQRRQDLLGG